MRSHLRSLRGQCVLVMALLLVTANVVCGHGAIPTDTPVDRLIENLAKYISEHPNDPEGYYRLGRVNMLALETKSGFVPAFAGRDGGLAEPAEGDFAETGVAWSKKPKDATEAQLKSHLAEAIRHLNKAIELDPAEARYRLTLACALEAGKPYLDRNTPWPLVSADHAREFSGRVREYSVTYAQQAVDNILRDERALATLTDLIQSRSLLMRDLIMQYAYEKRDAEGYAAKIQRLRVVDWDNLIEDQFFSAMCFALPSDGKVTQKPIWGGMKQWVSYEAGLDFIRVVEAREARPEDAIRMRVAREVVAAFDDLPRPGGITPIVIDLAGRPLRELLSETTSTFDLDGTGREQTWPWLKPDVGLLAWDPERTGQITSGRQLFGSVSWWLFFEHGYQALDVLDDNRNGELAGAELAGLVVWFDRNGDGVSQRGEIVAVEELGIAALSCRMTGMEDDSPMSAQGVRLSDGRVLPTYDWVVSPAAVQE